MTVNTHSIPLRRRLADQAATTLCVLATGLVLTMLALILWRLTAVGIRSLGLATFMHSTSPPGGQGGLLNAILGTLAMTTLGILLAIPVGVMAGTWLAEFGRRGRFAPVARFLNDTLLSVPSIIIGLFVYGLLVMPMHHFSGWAGTVALALIALPVIVRTTEDMLLMIPDGLREAAVSLGIPYWRVIVSVLWRAARRGIVTGVLLAVARISGETAPLLFTALNNQFLTFDMNAPMASLPVVIFQFAMSPYHDWQEAAWAGAFLISAGVLTLNLVARLLAGRGA